VPLDETARRRCSQWGEAREILPLRYRPGLPKLNEVEDERRRWLTDEEAAQKRGEARRDARAMVERQTRMITRLKQLPDGETFPYQLVVWRMGDAIWLAAQGEPYNLLQSALRQKFAGTPVVVCSIANGWGPSYLPPAELYDRGIYQESIAALAPGSLEAVIAEAASRIEKLLADGC
jgi:hypothetical protein